MYRPQFLVNTGKFKGTGGSIQRDVCKKALGRYLFTDLLDAKISNTKKEHSTEFEFDVFESLVLHWYTQWKRNPDVLSSFRFLCGCKEHVEFKRFLKPKTGINIYRGLNISNFKTPFAKEVMKKIKTKATLKKRIMEYDWVGYSEPYTPKYEIESWTNSESMSFGYGLPEAAANPKQAIRDQKTNLNNLKKAVGKYEKNASTQNFLLVEESFAAYGIPMMLISKPDSDSVMKPFFSNHIFKQATEGMMDPENEIVQLTKKPKPCSWYVPKIVQTAMNIVFR
jgi:hypothetical protein